MNHWKVLRFTFHNLFQSQNLYCSNFSLENRTLFERHRPIRTDGRRLRICTKVHEDWTRLGWEEPSGVLRISKEECRRLWRKRPADGHRWLELRQSYGSKSCRQGKQALWRPKWNRLFKFFYFFQCNEYVPGAKEKLILVWDTSAKYASDGYVWLLKNGPIYVNDVKVVLVKAAGNTRSFCQNVAAGKVSAQDLKTMAEQRFNELGKAANSAIVWVSGQVKTLMG